MLTLIAILLFILVLATEVGRAILVLVAQFIGGLLLAAVSVAFLYWLGWIAFR
jgi:hypothetical protein